MKDYEDIFGAQVDNDLNEQVENSNIDTVALDENVNPVLDSVFPSYVENVEPVTPVEEEPTDVNNVFGDVVETDEEVVNPVIPGYIETVDPVALEEIEPTEEVANPVIPDYAETVEPVALEEIEPAEEVANPVIPDYAETVEPVALEEIEPTEEVANPVIPDYTEAIEPVALEEIEPTEVKENNYNPMEHPDAKIVLNKEVEEETEEVDPEIKNMKIGAELKSNKSLMFVLGLGIILLIIIFAIPYISELLG